MILHLTDDSIIIDRIINDFEDVLPGQNIFLCFTNGAPQYVKKRGCVSYNKEGEEPDLTIFNGKIQKVIIHYLSRVKIEFVNRFIEKSIPVYWIIWGGDMYNNLITYHGYNIYYEPLYVGKMYYLLNILCNFLRIKSISNRIGKLQLAFIRERVDFFIANPSDFKWLQRICADLSSRACFDDFFYYPIDKYLKNKELCDMKVANNIIIGNSGSVTNNHLYAYKYLRKLNVSDRNIIVPLSYGGTNKYRAHVIRNGEKLWPTQFKPLTTLLPLDEYNDILASTSVCIFANWRQEAVGNILTLLGMGSKVFLSQKNPLYEYLVQLGFYIYPLEEICQLQIDKPFSTNEMMHNRNIVLAKFTKQALNEAILNIFSK